MTRMSEVFHRLERRIYRSMIMMIYLSNLVYKGFTPIYNMIFRRVKHILLMI